MIILKGVNMDKTPWRGGLIGNLIQNDLVWLLQKSKWQSICSACWKKQNLFHNWNSFSHSWSSHPPCKKKSDPEGSQWEPNYSPEKTTVRSKCPCSIACRFQGGSLCYSFFCLLVSSVSDFHPDTKGSVVDTFFFNESPVQVRCTILDAWGWCTGTTQRDGMGREVGGGFRMGNTCIPVADSFWYMAKPIQNCKVKK